jgi:hypothetical protein
MSWSAEGPEDPLLMGRPGLPASSRCRMRIGTMWSVGEGWRGKDAILGDERGDRCGTDANSLGWRGDLGVEGFIWDSCHVSSHEHPL